MFTKKDQHHLSFLKQLVDFIAQLPDTVFPDQLKLTLATGDLTITFFTTSPEQEIELIYQAENTSHEDAQVLIDIYELPKTLDKERLFDNLVTVLTVKH